MKAAFVTLEAFAWVLLQHAFGLEILTAFLALNADVTFEVEIHFEGLTALLACIFEVIVDAEVLDEAGFLREGLPALVAGEIVGFFDYLEFVFLLDAAEELEKLFIDEWDYFDGFRLDGWLRAFNNCLEHHLHVDFVVFGFECAISEDPVDLRDIYLVFELELILKIYDLCLNAIFFVFIEVNLLNLDGLIFYLVDYLKGLLKRHFFGSKIEKNYFLEL